METYTYYPPGNRAHQMAYQILVEGTTDCRHELLDNPWAERISVREGVLFITYSCRHCGRQLCQSFDEVLAPKAWNGAPGHVEAAVQG